MHEYSIHDPVDLIWYTRYPIRFLVFRSYIKKVSDRIWTGIWMSENIQNMRIFRILSNIKSEIFIFKTEYPNISDFLIGYLKTSDDLKLSLRTLIFFEKFNFLIIRYPIRSKFSDIRFFYHVRIMFSLIWNFGSHYPKWTPLLQI